MNIRELAKLIDAKYLTKYDNVKVNSFITDTKKLKKNDVFIAINKGHDHLGEIKTCKAIIVSNDYVNDEIPVLKVKDTKKALKDIAYYQRLKYRGKIIAITGSNGKTTTKELLSHLLEKKYKVYKTYKNTNNEIGVPLNLLSLDNSKIAILELGMNHPGEISELSRLVKPDYAIITNIGTAHIGSFGSQKKIFEAKMEILDGMPSNKLFVNGLDNFLKNTDNTIKVNFKNDFFEIKNVELHSEYLTFNLIIDKTYFIKYNIPSKEQLTNVALAIYVSLYMGVKPSKIASALNTFKPLENRLEIIKLKDKIVLNDSYNSNYESLMAGLATLNNYSLEKICVIGSILELGSKEKEIYKKIASNLNNDYEYIFVGNKIKAKKALYFNDVYALINYYLDNKEKFRNKVIYVKGSHGVKLEEFVKQLIM